MEISASQCSTLGVYKPKIISVLWTQESLSDLKYSHKLNTTRRLLHFGKLHIISCITVGWSLETNVKCTTSKLRIFKNIVRYFLFWLDFSLPLSSATFSIRDIFIFSRSLPNVSQIAMCQPPDERWLLDSFQCSLVFLELHILCLHKIVVSNPLHVQFA